MSTPTPSTPTPSTPTPSTPTPNVPTPALEVLATGPLALIQDLGRPGLAAIGVGRSGAADRGSFQLGAQLLAQDCAAAAIEVTLGGLVVRAHGAVVLALTGAPAQASVDGTDVAHLTWFVLGDGHTLRLATPRIGLRTYLSVRGGVDVPAVLGSRASDVLSGLGPAPLRVGDILPVGAAPPTFSSVDAGPARPMTNGPIAVRALLGPRDDWLADPRALAATPWTVSSRSDRVGIRLEGQALRRHESRLGQELLSEGVVRGSIQVPPDGAPVILLADHPVTGGYPVAAVVKGADVDLLAQAVPGQSVRITLETT
jgi:biotin-dependent carboxylase-like uncharacterized protein